MCVRYSSSTFVSNSPHRPSATIIYNLMKMNSPHQIQNEFTASHLNSAAYMSYTQLADTVTCDGTVAYRTNGNSTPWRFLTELPKLVNIIQSTFFPNAHTCTDFSCFDTPHCGPWKSSYSVACATDPWQWDWGQFNRLYASHGITSSFRFCASFIVQLWLLYSCELKWRINDDHAKQVTYRTRL